MSKRHKGDGRRAMVRLIALILCILLAGSAVVAALMTVAYAQERGSTELTLALEDALRGVRARQVTRYGNHTGERLTEVIFSLQANSLRRSWTAPNDDTALDAQPAAFSPGGVELFEVLVNGEAARWGVQGEAESFVSVACAIDPGDTAQFTFGYEVLLSETDGFLGTGDVGWRLSFFYLAPLVYDGALAQFDAVSVGAIGPSLYFDEQDFTVTVDAPDAWRVESGGEMTTTALTGGRTRTRIELTSARSFALALSRRDSAYVRDASGVSIALYTRHRASVNRALDAAQKAAEAYARLLGGTARDRFALAETDAPGPDASHDGLIFLDAALFGMGQSDALEREIAFQMAKQWLGVKVNANPAREPWLIDALARYLMLLYYEETYGYDRYLAQLNKNSLDALNVTMPGTLTVDSYLVEFASRAEYETVIIGRGAAALHELRVVLGEDVMRAALKSYYQENAHQIASIADFASALNGAAAREVDVLLLDTLARIAERGGQAIEWYE